MAWTDKAIQFLKDLFKEDPRTSASQAAAEMGKAGFSFSRNAVIGFIHRKGHQHGLLLISAGDKMARKGGRPPGARTSREAAFQARIERVRSLRPIPRTKFYAMPGSPDVIEVDKGEGPIFKLKLKGVRNVSFWDLNEVRDCRWPLGDPKKDMKYCGQLREHLGLSNVPHMYCPYHGAKRLAIAQQKGQGSGGEATPPAS